MLFNSLTIGVESPKGWEVVAGIPVYWSFTDPVERFGIQRSDYSKSNTGVTSLLIGKKTYFGNWYAEPNIVCRWVDCDWIINNKPGWPVNSDFLTDIFTVGIGCTIGYKVKLSNRFSLNCFAGPEVGYAYLTTHSKSVNMKDADWMADYYIPHEYHEAFPVRVSDKLTIHRDGYDVISKTRGFYQSIRAGVGISYTF
jgi:hypothetical protein